MAYNEYKQYGSGNIPTISTYIIFDNKDIWNTHRVEYHDDIIKREDKKLINSVVDRFADYSATDLVSLTQRQIPWITAIKKENKEITQDAICQYFNE